MRLEFVMQFTFRIAAILLVSSVIQHAVADDQESEFERRLRSASGNGNGPDCLRNFSQTIDSRWKNHHDVERYWKLGVTTTLETLAGWLDEQYGETSPGLDVAPVRNKSEPFGQTLAERDDLSPLARALLQQWEWPLWQKVNEVAKKSGVGSAGSLVQFFAIKTSGGWYGVVIPFHVFRGNGEISEGLGAGPEVISVSIIRELLKPQFNRDPDFGIRLVRLKGPPGKAALIFDATIKKFAQ